MHRGPELVAHVRQKPRLEFVGSPQVIRAIVQLRVQGDDAAVGLLQLAIEPRELVLPVLQGAERQEQLAILMLVLFGERFRRSGRERAANIAEPLSRDDWGAPRQPLQQRDARASTGLRVDQEIVDEPPRPEDPEPHPRGRAVAAEEHRIEVRDPGAVVHDTGDEGLRRGVPIHEIGDLSVPRVAERVADESPTPPSRSASARTPRTRGGPRFPPRDGAP